MKINTSLKCKFRYIQPILHSLNFKNCFLFFIKFNNFLDLAVHFKQSSISRQLKQSIKQRINISILRHQKNLWAKSDDNLNKKLGTQILINNGSNLILLTSILLLKANKQIKDPIKHKNDIKNEKNSLITLANHVIATNQKRGKHNINNKKNDSEIIPPHIPLALARNNKRYTKWL